MYNLTKILDLDTIGDVLWVSVGLFGQLMFTGRFLVQWWASERAGRSVVPVAFWWFSIVGSMIVLAYGVHKLDLVIMLGQAPGTIIYSRNLWLIRREQQRAEGLG